MNFSSQYGTARTASYTAGNLKGGLKVYDRYGDFPEAFVLVCVCVCVECVYLITPELGGKAFYYKPITIGEHQDTKR